MVYKQEELQKMVEDFFRTDKYSLLVKKKGFLVADKLQAFGGDRETFLLWIPPVPTEVENFNRVESSLLDEFRILVPQYPNAKSYVLAVTTGGFSRNFLSELKRLRIKLRVPIQFFDTPFKHEEAEEVASILRAFADKNHKEKRIKQPYSVLQDSEFHLAGDDLLEKMVSEFKAPMQKPCLRIIVGAAGIGKSWLFKSIYTNLYAIFTASKKEHQIFPRPIPFVPDYLRETITLRTDKLIDNFLATEVATPVSRNVFEWMLVNGFSLWLFDGLDELYTEDPEFFDILLELLTRPNSRAQILIFARNSLLKTSASFASFLEEYHPNIADNILIYQLVHWEYASKRAFAWNRLTGKSPSKDSTDPLDVSNFLTIINHSNSLKQLSKLPYYCDLLMNKFRQGSLTEVSDEFSLVETVVDGMIKRELDKGVLSQQHFENNGLNDWLESIALEFYEREPKILYKNDLEEYANLVLKSELAIEVKANTITSLVQFPLFVPGIKPGTITFDHELIAEYLAGQYLLKQLAKDPIGVARKLGNRFDIADSLIMRYLASKVGGTSEYLQIIIDTLRRNVLPNRTFANLLQLLLLATPKKDIIKSNNIDLQGRDLKYLLFVQRDLKDMSLRNCDLSQSTFRNCEMQNTLFEGAILAGTKFEELKEGSLLRARFGDLDRFEYIYHNKQRIDDYRRMRKWVEQFTGIKPPPKEPCPTANQIRALFHKFIHLDGSGRRIEVPEIRLLRGKRYPDAPKIEDCVKACCQFGYLEGPDFRKRYKRVSSDKYNEMVNFVKEWQLSTEMRQLLNALCTKINCEHIPVSNRL